MTSSKERRIGTYSISLIIAGRLCCPSNSWSMYAFYGGTELQAWARLPFERKWTRLMRLMRLTRSNDLSCSPLVQSGHGTVIFVQQMGMGVCRLNGARLTRNRTGYVKNPISFMPAELSKVVLLTTILETVQWVSTCATATWPIAFRQNVRASFQLVQSLFLYLSDFYNLKNSLF